MYVYDIIRYFLIVQTSNFLYNISYSSQLYLQKSHNDIICSFYVQIYRKDIVSTYLLQFPPPPPAVYLRPEQSLDWF